MNPDAIEGSLREIESARPSIFRPDAVRRYRESRQQSVLPRLVCPRSFLYLWIFLGILIAAGMVMWFETGGILLQK